MPSLPTNCGCIRALVAQMAVVLAAYWCLFAACQFPWIVGPDSSPSDESAAKWTSVAGVWMAVVSGATFCFVAGLFGLGRRSWWAAFALVLGAAVGVPPLYPDRLQTRTVTWCIAA